MLGKVARSGPSLGRPRINGFSQHLLTLPSVPSIPYPWREEYRDILFLDPNQNILAVRVSPSAPVVYKPTCQARLHPSVRPLRVITVDVGMK